MASGLQVEELISQARALKEAVPGSSLAAMNGRAWSSPKMQIHPPQPVPPLWRPPRALHSLMTWVELAVWINFPHLPNRQAVVAWFNILDAGASIGPHDHHQATYGAVCHLAGEGDLIFDLSIIGGSGEQVSHAAPGRIAIFPGKMIHRVEPVPGERISVAMNFHLEEGHGERQG